MVNAVVQLSKYLITIVMLLFTLQSFTALKERDEYERRYILGKQILMILLLDFICFFVMFLQKGETEIIRMYLLLMAYILMVQVLYRLIYKKASMILVNNMCMLLSISIIMLTRLNISKAVSQFHIMAASTLICFIIPVVVRKVKFLKNLTWFYAMLGIAMLAAVMVLGFTSGGAKLSIEFHGFTFQFSELAKITMVFFLAGILRDDNSFPNVVKATVIAAVHVLILVASTDLGTAFVFFMAYVVIIYVATRKARYPLLGLSGMCLACIAAYFMFAHVRNRVALWKDPIASWDISSQLAQGLFGMCSGGWFGTGLYEGRPDLIPVAVKDFIFSAICEELGIIFGICLILLCMSTFLLIINISMKMSKRFYKLIAMGLGTEYATQVFLTVGGTIKFIPMTGITLPLVSYGGSSLLSTIVMLSIIQGLYILREDEGEALEKRNRQNKRKKQKDTGQGRKKENRQSTGQRDNTKRKPKAEDDLERRIEEETEKSLHW
ncbi:MAG: FtsW/RodA/SpoVE family cell cycle protein [Fusicatenibacter sp.]